MKVRAIKKGYYGLLLHEPGTSTEEFTLKNDADFSEKWMERMPEKKRKDDTEEEPERKVSRGMNKDKYEKSVI